MDLRKFLLQQRGFADDNENKVYFTDRGLYQEPQDEEFWLFLDEGLRCGGTARKIPCDKEYIKAVLLGCGKIDLWQKVFSNIEKWKKENS
ncbi:hypothetical protein CLNEO_11900 [Anaerotignum neopropionicum]|uniref:Uncharacterized protein n=1 Tax=Anaerotignum neopropionicum TaxID=36847 RepID=A0A136WFT1_9FIRM|nr:hypothetical protein [Anaerotignum neopropionicum]KXL53219.1 hypothetical protein CLNEO_11900 [Anaerotignum neopropionicum]